MTRLLKTIFGLAGYRRYKAATNVLLNALLDPVRDPAKCFKFSQTNIACKLRRPARFLQQMT